MNSNLFRSCAKVMCTKTQEEIKIIECGFFLFERCILGIETAKISPNEIFNDFAISREPFDEIDSNFFILKLWTRQ